MSSVFISALSGSIAAMAKLVVVLSVGMLSAHLGFLNSTFIPQLSGFTFIFITGCQVLSNLGREFSIEKLAVFWPLLFWGVYSIGLGFIVALVYCKIFKPPKEYITSIVSCTAFANTIGLPIVIFDSLSSSLYSNANRTPLEAYQEAVAMTFVFSVPWNLIMYIIGYPYVLELKPVEDGPQVVVESRSDRNDGIDDDDDDNDDNDDNDNNDNNDNKSLLHTKPDHVVHDDTVMSDDSGLDKRYSIKNLSKLPNNSPTLGQFNLDNDEISSSYLKEIDQSKSLDNLTPLQRLEVDIDDDSKFPQAPVVKFFTEFENALSKAFSCLGYYFNRYFLSKLKPSHQFTFVMLFTNPPTIATLFSIVIGLIPPIKDPFYQPDGIFHFVIKAIDFIALSSAPLSNLVTSANIYHSIQRNYGPEARELQRIIDVVRETQTEPNNNNIAQSESGSDSGPNSPQDDNFETNNDYQHDQFVDITFNNSHYQIYRPESDQLKSINKPIIDHSVDLPINTKHPKRDYFPSHQGHEQNTPKLTTFSPITRPASSSTYNSTITPIPEINVDTFNRNNDIARTSTRSPQTSHISSLNPSSQQQLELNPTSSSVLLLSPSSSSSLSNISGFDQNEKKPPKISESPLQSTDSTLNNDNFELLNRSYSYIPRQPIRSLSLLHQQGLLKQYLSQQPQNMQQQIYRDISSELGQLDALGTMDLKENEKNNQQNGENNGTKNNTPTKLETIMSKIDPRLPIDYDPVTNEILPLPRLTWAQMFGVSICRLVIVPLIVFLTMLLCQVLDIEDIILPKSALYRAYIMLASCSVSADSILMIITKAMRTRQSMAMSLLYVLQYGLCLITIPLWLVLINSVNSEYNV